MQEKIVVLLLILVIAISACSSPKPPTSEKEVTFVPSPTLPAPTDTLPSPLPSKMPSTTPSPSPSATASSGFPTPLATATRPPTYPTRFPIEAPLKYRSILVETGYTRVGETLVHGKKLFFTGRIHPSAAHSLPNAIFEHDLKSGKTKLLTLSVHGEKGVVCCLDASDHWLAWMTYLEWGGLWRVYAKNLDTGKEVVVDKLEDVDAKAMPRGTNFAIWGNNIVWTPVRDTKEGKIVSEVVVENLAKGEKKVIAKSAWPEAMKYVDIYKNYVVWSKGSQADGKPRANVYLYDLSSGQTVQLTKDDISWWPRIYGKYIVWRQGFYDYGPIVIEKREETGYRYRLSMKGRWLRLGDGLLLFIGPDGTEYVYDLDQNTIQSLPVLGAGICGRNVSFTVGKPSSESPVYRHGTIEVREYER